MLRPAHRASKPLLVLRQAQHERALSRRRLSLSPLTLSVSKGERRVFQEGRGRRAERLLVPFDCAQDMLRRAQHERALSRRRLPFSPLTLSLSKGEERFAITGDRCAEDTSHPHVVSLP